MVAVFFFKVINVIMTFSVYSPSRNILLKSIVIFQRI